MYLRVLGRPCGPPPVNMSLPVDRNSNWVITFGPYNDEYTARTHQLGE